MPLSVIMRENGKLPSIALQEYLVYLKQGIALIRVLPAPGDRADSRQGRTSPPGRSEHRFQSGYGSPGVYEVTYQYTGEAGTGKTILTVVVE